MKPPQKRPWYALYQVNRGRVTYLYGGYTPPAGTGPRAAAEQRRDEKLNIVAFDDRACLYRDRNLYSYLLVRYDDLVQPDPHSGIPWVDEGVTTLAQELADKFNKEAA